jgi:uncharacterized membrane protein
MVQNNQENDGETDGIEVSSKVFLLLIFGFILIFAGFAVLVISSFALGGSGSVGGVILIGPIPIVFGAGPDAGWLILIGVVITVLSVVSFLVLNRRSRENND